MHADEVDVDVELVRRLVASQFPEWATLPVREVPEWGTDNALFRLGDELVARLPRVERAVATLEHERTWLPKLAPHLPLHVPVPVADGAADETYPWTWSVFRWLDGETASPERIEDPDAAAVQLAEFVRALQAVDGAGGPPPGPHNAFRGCPLAHRDESVRRALVALRDEIDVAHVTALWNDALAAPEWATAPVWIHGDLDSRNLLVRDGRLCAVLDFGTAGIGDPASDVMAAWKLLAPRSRDVLRHALGVDDATWTRARGWALSQALGAITYYSAETNPSLFAAGRRWLTAVLTDDDA